MRQLPSLLAGALLLGACQAAGRMPFSESVVDAARPGPRPALSASLPSREATAWGEIVSARIRDGATAFVEDSGGFRASIDDRGMSGTFQEDGAHLAFGARGVTIATSAVGRAGDSWAPSPPALGACVPGKFDPMGQCLQRLEYAGDNVVEWWTTRPAGFEQGWTFATAPRGDGPLTVDVSVRGAKVEVDADGVKLFDQTDVVGVMSDVTARDADGETLDVQVVATADGVRFEVTDAGAAYPVKVDPTYSDPDWELANGEDTVGDRYFGTAVVGAGDLDGDGYDDVLVSANSHIYVYLGSATGLATESANSLSPEHSTSYFYSTVAPAGDVNGDGYADVIVPAREYDSAISWIYVYMGSHEGVSAVGTTLEFLNTGLYSSGCGCDGAGDVDGDGYDDIVVKQCNVPGVDVFRGSASGVLPTPTVVLNGGASEGFGSSVAGVGDVNGDGYDDVGVGTYSGKEVYLFEGSVTGTMDVPTTILSGTASRFGEEIAAAGDVDGDGFDDILVGTDRDGSYLFQGSPAGLAATPSAHFTDASASFSTSVTAAAGDVNGDGYDDVIIGAPYPLGAVASRVYVYLGAAAGMSATPSASLEGESGISFGRALAGVGDVNGDGYSDIVIGASDYGGWQTPGRDTGRAYVYQGSSTGLSTSPNTYLDNHYREGFGLSMAAVGDVNGDGYDDVAIGECGYLGGIGEVFIYTGSPAGPSTTPEIVYRGDHPMGSFGCALSGGGDVNGDGYDDIAIGASDYYSTGYVDVFHGSASGLPDVPTVTLTGDDVWASFGAAVAMAGDVNHDGYDDLVVGSPGFYALEALVYYGSASGIDVSAFTNLPGPVYPSTDPYHGPYYSSSFGSSVAGAGDVDGDGYDDVIVGGGNDYRERGTAMIYRGGATGIGWRPETRLTGEPRSQDHFGFSVSGAGDIDGDGYDDVIVGAPDAVDASGSTYVYRGSARGLDQTSLVVLADGEGGAAAGGSVSSAGDLNGDGYDDVIVGNCSSDDYWHYAAGASVHLGSPEGIPINATFTLTSPAGSDTFGCPVASAGDVDGDGYDDVLVADGGDPGSVAIFRGCADADADGYCAANDCDDTTAAITIPYIAYADTDGDGYGDSAVTTTACAAVAGYVAAGGDCDESDPDVNPGGRELCDAEGIDEDCDGLINDDDDSAEGKTLVYGDDDGDGYAGAPASFCLVSEGFSADGPDCDDADAAIHPGAAEVCDAANTDQDCDGLVDDDDADVTGQTFYYRDSDGDGYGQGAPAPMCERRRGYSPWDGDCNDADAAIHPRATERCDVADTDEDCDGVADDADMSAVGRTIFHGDADGDGFGSSVTTFACDAPPTYVARGGDCDDAEPGIHIGATEVCDAGNVDEDCDGLTNDADPSVVGQRTFYIDNDGDGYGSVLNRQLCHPTASYSPVTGDCDDMTAAVHPGAVEIGGDGIDENCDGRGT